VSDQRVVLDSGVVGLASSDQEFRLVLRDLVRSGWSPVIPTVVLSEAISGRATDAPVNHALKRIGTTDTTEATARRAGRLRSEVERGGGRRVPSGIDSMVAAHALEADRAVVFTTDPRDLSRLLADHPSVLVERV
jgi:predicted nucleic acid-binding protein